MHNFNLITKQHCGRFHVPMHMKVTSCLSYSDDQRFSQCVSLSTLASGSTRNRTVHMQIKFPYVTTRIHIYIYRPLSRCRHHRRYGKTVLTVMEWNNIRTCIHNTYTQVIVLLRWRPIRTYTVHNTHYMQYCPFDNLVFWYCCYCSVPFLK